MVSSVRLYTEMVMGPKINTSRALKAPKIILSR